MIVSLEDYYTCGCIFQDSARLLADVIIDMVVKVSSNLNLESVKEMDEADENYIRKSIVESMQVCFGLGFEVFLKYFILYL